MGRLYTVSVVKRNMRSQGRFGRIAEREEQMTSIHQKKRLRKCHTMKQTSLTDFGKCMSTDESIFETVSQCRQFVQQQRGPVQTRFILQDLVKS